MASKFDFCDTKIEIKPPGQKKRYISEMIWLNDLEKKMNDLKNLVIPDFPDKVIKDIVVTVKDEEPGYTDEFGTYIEGYTIWNVEGFIVEIVKFDLDTNEAVVAWEEFWEISQSPLKFEINSLYNQTSGALNINWN